MTRIHKLNRLGVPLTSLVNWLRSWRIVRWMLKKVGGIDPVATAI